MKQIIFTVYDVKADAFLPTWMAHQPGIAYRTFSDAVNNKETAIGKHPEDYTIFELGYWEDTTAEYLIHKAPKSRGNGLEFLIPEKPQQLDIEEIANEINANPQV